MQTSVQLPGGRTSIATNSGGYRLPFPWKRLFVTDRPKVQFLIDNSSDLCCYPHRLLHRHIPKTKFVLNTANSITIPTYESLPLNLNFSLRCDFRWNFIIADVTMLIIGADLLAHYHPLPDYRTENFFWKIRLVWQFWVPKKIVCDEGREFRNKTMNEFCK